VIPHWVWGIGIPQCLVSNVQV